MCESMVENETPSVIEHALDEATPGALVLSGQTGSLGIVRGGKGLLSVSRD